MSTPSSRHGSARIVGREHYGSAVSSRVSKFGTLGDRVAKMKTPRTSSATTPKHVWVRSEGDEIVPGLLLSWIRGGDGGWSGLVATAVTGTEAVVTRIPAARLRPA